MITAAGEIGALLARARSGDEDALGQLCAVYRPFLQTIASMKLGRALGRRVDASDIVQDTEFELARGLEQFHGSTEPELSAWLRQILHRKVANQVRDNRAACRDLRRETYLDGDHGPSASITWLQPVGREASPSQFVIRGEAALRFAAVLVALPADQSAVVRMRYVEGMKISEIATTMKKSAGAVAGLLRRGQRALREQLGSVSDFV